MPETKLASMRARMPEKSNRRQDSETTSEWLQKVWKFALREKVQSAARGVRVIMKRSRYGASGYIFEIFSWRRGSVRARMVAGIRCV